MRYLYDFLKWIASFPPIYSEDNKQLENIKLRATEITFQNMIKGREAEEAWPVGTTGAPTVSIQKGLEDITYNIMSREIYIARTSLRRIITHSFLISSLGRRRGLKS